MSIAFIGAGKVATAFGRYLYDHGISISGYYDPHQDKVDHACRVTRGRSFASAADAAAGAAIVLITTRDDQIGDACDALCRQDAIGEGHLVGHMSGAHASDLLACAARRGAAVFSLHPLQAFASEDKAVADLPDTWFSLEGDDTRLEKIEALLKKTENRYFRIAAEHKSLYHLAACILSNYLTTTMDAGMAALALSGIDPEQGFEAMLPLIRGSLNNIAAIGPARALTGPIARGDAHTVRRHLEALDNRGAADLKAFYCAMGQRTVSLARRQDLTDSDALDAVDRLLKDPNGRNQASSKQTS